MADQAPTGGARQLLDRDAIRLSERAANQTDAIRRCGAVLIEVGAVEAAYVEAMLDRESSISTYVGEGVAIPHGTLAAKDAVRRDALAVLRFPDGIDWAGQQVNVCVAIAARGNDHVALLAELAELLLDPDKAQALRDATNPDEVLALMTPREDSN